MHFTDEGRIDTDNKRQGKSKRDAYRVRDKSLVSKRKEIQNITDCEFLLTWYQRGKMGKGGFTNLLGTKILLKEEMTLY